jgi:site-specific recombinase XerD
MNIDKKTTLINLITEDLPRLNDAALAELYSIEKRLLNGTTLNNIRDIDRDTLINNFIDQHQLNSAASTIYNYKIILKDFINFASGVLDNELLMSYLHSKVWGENTKLRNYILLKRFLYYLFTYKYTETDLSTHIKIPVKVKGRSFCPMSEQVLEFLDAIKFSFTGEDEIKKYETLFKLYIKTGCRRNELLNLNVEDIDFETGRIIIRKTKNGDEKIMPMDSNLRQLLLTYLDYFKYKSGPLFRGIHGNGLCKQSLMNAFNKIKTRAGLPKEFKIHSLRRFFINELRKHGIDIATIQKLTGHRDIRTTEIYCNVSDEEKVRAIESIRV